MKTLGQNTTNTTGTNPGGSTVTKIINQNNTGGSATAGNANGNSTGANGGEATGAQPATGGTQPVYSAQPYPYGGYYGSGYRGGYGGGYGGPRAWGWGRGDLI